LDADLTNESISMKLISNSGSIIRTEIPCSEKIFLTPKNGFTLEKLASALDQADGVERISVEEWFLPPRYRKKTEVLVAEIKPFAVKRILNCFKGKGVADAWNLFPTRIQRVLRSLGITASSFVGVKGNSIRPLEELGCLEYPLPELRPLCLRFEGWAGRPNKPSWRSVEKIVLESDGFSEEIPVDRAKEVIDFLRDFKPHLLIFEGKGWRKLMEGVPGFKEAVNEIDSLVLDSFSFLDVDLLGIIEWSKLSAMPIKLIVSASIGKVLTSIEAFRAFEWKYLIPEVRVTIEEWKSPERLLKADRGGIILTPKPRIYWNVVQLDFNSLFPTIIAKNNISPETVNDLECSGPKIEVPEVGHTICFGRRGLVAEVVGELVERRAKLRTLASLAGSESKRYDSAQAAVKWILVACFGYLGYRNARFGSIEAYECVTALARDTLFRAMFVAEEMGFKVLHALVDSLFIEVGSKDRTEVQRLIKAIEEETGYSLKVEADYTWVAFFNDVSRKAGVPSRYLGRLKSGGIKAKGLELCRRDAPLFIKRTMGECLSIVSQAKGRGELREALKKAMNLMKRREVELYSGLVDESELVINRRISKPVKEYKKRVAHVLAAKETGSVVKNVRYVESQMPYPVDFGPMGYLASKYASWLKRAARPFREMLDRLSSDTLAHAKIDW